eukprot:TRINITY_DN10520_c0_g1_i2.p1 TRINITY_DN10520_c0_g1~~TRINITY_DN10520_c0_g1_i2.p1  ORF type:complete len:430 (+),score=87.89 TRINITY_DN10520_c0_g1_i2:38-1327(+)
MALEGLSLVYSRCMECIEQYSATILPGVRTLLQTGEGNGFKSSDEFIKFREAFSSLLQRGMHGPIPRPVSSGMSSVILPLALPTDPALQLKRILVHSFAQRMLERLNTHEMHACALMAFILSRQKSLSIPHGASSHDDGASLPSDIEDATKILQVRLIQLRQHLRTQQDAVSVSKPRHVRLMSSQVPAFLAFLAVALPLDAAAVPDTILSPFSPSSSRDVVWSALETCLAGHIHTFLSKWASIFVSNDLNTKGVDVNTKMMNNLQRRSYMTLLSLPVHVLRTIISTVYSTLMSVHKASIIYMDPNRFKNDVASEFLSIILAPHSPLATSLVDQFSQVIDALVEEHMQCIRNDIQIAQQALLELSEPSFSCGEPDQLSDLMARITALARKVREDVLAPIGEDTDHDSRPASSPFLLPSRDTPPDIALQIG